MTGLASTRWLKRLGVSARMGLLSMKMLAGDRGDTARRGGALAGASPKLRRMPSGSGGVNGEGGCSGGRRSGGKGGGQAAGMTRSDDCSLGEGIGRKSPLGLKVSGVLESCRRSTTDGKAGVKEEAKLSPESEVRARSGGSFSGGSAPVPG